MEEKPPPVPIEVSDAPVEAAYAKTLVACAEANRRPRLNCVEPKAPAVACGFCAAPVFTCATPEGHDCPEHPGGMQDESGRWFCSPRCWLNAHIWAYRQHLAVMKGLADTQHENVMRMIAEFKLRAEGWTTRFEVEQARRLRERTEWAVSGLMIGLVVGALLVLVERM